MPRTPTPRHHLSPTLSTILGAVLVCLPAAAETASRAADEADEATEGASDSARAATADWPRFGGPRGDGVWPGATSLDGDFLLERWRRELGSGYSSILAVDGVLYTVETDGKEDVAIALDAESGRPRWRTPIGPTYVGHTGSDDGPIATPAVDDETFVALTGHGRLVALETGSGRHRWTRDLAELGAEEPYYGIGTSPWIEGDRVVVYAGGTAGLVAFDRATGDTHWTNTEVTGATYASPVAVRVLDRRVLLLATAGGVFAVSPEDGSLSWRHPFGDEHVGEIDRTPLVLDGERLFLPLSSAPSRMWRATRDEEAGVVLEELWRSARLGRSHGPPVVVGDSIFGTHGSLLVCLDAQTGDVRWRHRVYDGTLIAVGDRLAVLSAASGMLHWIEATGEEFRPLDERQVLEVGYNAVTPPSFDGETLYLRSVHEVVALGFAAEEQASAHPGSDLDPGPWKERWRRRFDAGLLTAGNGPPTVAGDSVYVVAAEGERDRLLALRLRDGELRWRVDLAPVDPGSWSGPMAAAAVDDGRVFVVGSDCVLHTVAEDDGAELWTLDLRERFGTVESGRGCQTIPLVHAGRVVVQANGETEHRLVALAAEDGALVWTTAGEAPGYATSPVAMKLLGREQIVVHGHRISDEGGASVVWAVDPEDGRMLWSHALKEGMSFWNPLQAGPDSLMLSTWNEGFLLELEEGPDGIEVHERLTVRDFSLADATAETLFGYIGSDFVALDRATGDRRWSERATWGYGAPAGEDLVLAAFNTGRLRVARRDADAYREIARIQVFQAGAQTDWHPTIVGDTILVRNGEEIVVLDRRARAGARAEE